MDSTVRFFAMPIGTQISNVGSEVQRALRWRKAGNRQREISFCEKAIEFLTVMQQDPKNEQTPDRRTRRLHLRIGRFFLG